MKRVIASLVALFAVAACSSAVTGPYCPGGEVACGSGCMPPGSVCCDGAGDYCPSGTLCNVGAGTCISPRPANPCDGCLAQGQECCTNNTDGVDDCAPLGASCCGNHHYCPVGYVCGGTCGSACCP